MARLKPEQRHLLIDAISRGIKKSLVGKVFGVTYKTIRKWLKRTKHLKDRKREPRRTKVTELVELYILGIRNTFGWGTYRIQQALQGNLPSFMEDKLREFGIQKPDKIKLSRTAINNILSKYGLNGYARKHKAWKFFRAKEPNELWQLDIKGPFTVQGKKYYFIVCIDDYSRNMVLAKQFEHAPCIKEITLLLELLIKMYVPKKILTDNNPFKEEWDSWCKEKKVEPLHAHPYYPQDKGKVERAIKNVAEEFINLLKKFPEWLDGKIEEYRIWYNEHRFSLGINNYPARLFSVT